jgi:predicted DNA-binding protein (MmcQ/YjbR family)
MNIEDYRTFCLELPASTEGFPFDAKTLVFKVAGKLFALTNVETFQSINLKCNPEKAIELREVYESVLPGYHMSKKHWNTIRTDESLSDELIFQWTKESYDLVVQSLTKKTKSEFSL